MAIRDILGIAVKLAIASLIVGLLLSWLDLSPRTLLRQLPDLVGDGLRLLSVLADWAMRYILPGAVVVVPVWAAFALFRLLRRR